MVLACWGRRHDERDRLGAHMLGVSEGARVPSVSGWRATMVNDIDILVEELGFVVLVEDLAFATAPRRAVLRLQTGGR